MPRGKLISTMKRAPGKTARLRPRLRRASPPDSSAGARRASPPEHSPGPRHASPPDSFAGPRKASPSAPRRAATSGATDSVPRREVTSSAYQRLRDLIVTGRLAPGEPLIETELSARLGVSRTPIRAALQRLQQEGFVSASRAGSMLRAAVAPLTADDMREVFMMVGALEAAAARASAGLAKAGRTALSDRMARLTDRLHVGGFVAAARHRRGARRARPVPPRVHRGRRRAAPAGRARGAAAAGRALRACLRERGRPGVRRGVPRARRRSWTPSARVTPTAPSAPSSVTGARRPRGTARW